MLFICIQITFSVTNWRKLMPEDKKKGGRYLVTHCHKVSSLNLKSIALLTTLPLR